MAFGLLELGVVVVRVWSKMLMCLGLEILEKVAIGGDSKTLEYGPLINAR